jgi:dienelactone hydrolase
MSTDRLTTLCKEIIHFIPGAFPHLLNSSLLKKFTLVMLVLSFLTVPAMAQIQQKIVMENFDFSYKGRSVRGTVFRPEAARRYPGVLVINGNAEAFAREGFFAVTIQSDDDMDFREAIDRMTSHKFCKSRVGVTGFSFGGALSMVLAAKNPKVGAVVEISGLLVPQNNIDLSKDIQAAVMFVSGERDPLVPVDGTKKMYEQFKKSGKPCNIYIAPGQGHGFSPEYNSIVFRKSVEFFKRNL